ncbi:glutathione-disulfide reductase [Luteimonas vadosa]|uniref:Glutathione-disulfide reductase n=1 Tax=Luteimonas vadosa TaxID=1165507 RepID=A0ABP9E8D0_9GAMM
MSGRPDPRGFDFDLVVLGGGSGGLAAAFRAAGHGARVALVEPGELGGTCVNVGCVPKKAMWLAAQTAERIELARRMGFAGLPCPELDWREFVTLRQHYIANIHASYRRRLDEAGIVSVVGRGRFEDARTIITDDGARLHGDHVVIATGARPRRPAIPGADLGLVSDDFFHFVAPPGRVAMIGGGYIGVELAGVLQRLGCPVEMFMRGPCLLQGFERDLAEHLEEDYRQAGTALHFGFDLQAVERSGDGKLRVSSQGGDAQGGFDQVIFAIGREPVTASLGLERAGVECDGQGHVRVDDFQDTSADRVHAVGDVTDRIQLTPVAIAAARRLMDRVFGGHAEARLDYDDIPTVVFSHPPIGKVGLSEAEARKRHGDDVHVYRSDFRAMLHALADVPQRSLFKLVCVGEDRRVAGIHLLGEGADEILQGFAVALKKGITLADLHDTVAIHPTSAEEVVLMR